LCSFYFKKDQFVIRKRPLIRPLCPFAKELRFLIKNSGAFMVLTGLND